MYTLYSAPTGNGRKPAVLLEELGAKYTYKPINILSGDQFDPSYIKHNPNSKIPTLIDHSNDDFAVFESGAILLYLAEKYATFIPSDSRQRSEMIQWLFFQNAGVGPMFGQFGHFFLYGRDKCDHPYPLERYTKEAKRLLQVIDNRLAHSEYIGGAEYTIADISMFPWIGVLIEYFKAEEVLGLYSHKHLMKWYNSCMGRAAVKKAFQVIG